MRGGHTLANKIKDTDYLGDKQSEDLFLWDSGVYGQDVCIPPLDALGSGVRGIQGMEIGAYRHG